MSRARVKSPRPRLAERLADPALLAALTRFVGARVPSSEVDDIVQSVVADAMVSTHPPTEEEQVAPWVHGIARHKVVDWFRANRREVPQDPELQDAVGALDNVAEASDLYRWAQKELPEGEEHKRTLEWMLREGAGEKLEAIAADANEPAPRVRQRVSRLRRHYKARWAAQAAALAALLVIVLAIVMASRRKPEEIAPRTDPSAVPTAPSPEPIAPEPPPEQRAEQLRRDALEKCDDKAWQECLDGLDAAKAVDPSGDVDPEVAGARVRALRALLPPPLTTSTAPAPVTTSTPPVKPPNKPFQSKKGPSRSGSMWSDSVGPPTGK